MQLQVWRAMAYDTDDGVLPATGVMFAAPGTAAPIGERWFARYTASGYMDCTDAVSAPTIHGAVRECVRLYGDDTPGSADRLEAAQLLRQARANGVLHVTLGANDTNREVKS